MRPHGTNYIYWPDGGLGAKPRDGTVWIDPVPHGSAWVFYDVTGWVKQGRPAPPVLIRETISAQSQAEVEKCECGASAVNSSLHSNWCPLNSGDLL